MQFNFISFSTLLLLLAPTVLSVAAPAPTAAPNPAAAADLGDIGDKIDSVIDDLKEKASNVIEDLKDFTFPIITGLPESIDKWFDDVEEFFEEFPDKAWESIKDGIYPPEVSQWVNDLPQEMRAEASQKLKEWADELSAAGPRQVVGKGTMMGMVGIIGVVAVVMAL
ncbi:hypothetical protein BDZ91DRAFT_726562 [Kalaharituber pfeilii]|nr:hypothetical protein BDZ91DRAFT_726562 [Kalaharituber pfeilii]